MDAKVCCIYRSYSNLSLLYQLYLLLCRIRHRPASNDIKHSNTIGQLLSPDELCKTSSVKLFRCSSAKNETSSGLQSIQVQLSGEKETKWICSLWEGQMRWTQKYIKCAWTALFMKWTETDCLIEDFIKGEAMIHSIIVRFTPSSSLSFHFHPLIFHNSLTEAAASLYKGKTVLSQRMDHLHIQIHWTRASQPQFIKSPDQQCCREVTPEPVSPGGSLLHVTDFI